jgi:DNA-binding transcriptional ArsR family regulator
MASVVTHGVRPLYGPYHRPVLGTGEYRTGVVASFSIFGLTLEPHDRASGDSAGDRATAIADICRQLAHPLRVVLLEYVARAGPCPFSELVEAAGLPTAQVSNHLAVLRRAGLLVTERQGRQSLYRLPNSHLAEVLANLGAAVGAEAAVPDPAFRPVGSQARTCYDHTGGRLGVRLLQALLEREALTGDPLGPDGLTEGPAASAVLPAFGVPQWQTLRDGRRRFAHGCPDWTEKAPHLSGALGAAVTQSLHHRDWVRPRPGSRALDVTEQGGRALRGLGVSV